MYANSAERFDELWHRFRPRIFAYFRRQFDSATAEDLCQQTFLKAWKYISSHENTIRNEKSWIFAIASNVKNDHIRYVQLYRMNSSYVDLYETDILTECNLDESLCLQKAFEKLTEEEKQLLSMAQYLKSSEIGSVFGISASGARNRIQKAKESLNKILSEFEINC